MPGIRSVKACIPRQVSVPFSSQTAKWTSPSGPSHTLGQTAKCAHTPQQERRSIQVSPPPQRSPSPQLPQGVQHHSPQHSPQLSSVPCPLSSVPWPQQSPRGGNTLGFDDLYLDGALFDPCQPPMKAQLFQKMRMQPNALVEPMRGGIGMGACNAGMWILRDGTQCFVLKLIRSNSPGMNQLQASDADKFAKLSRENPGIVKDPSISFPCKIFHCLSKSGIKNHDLIVMRQVSGVRMSEFIMNRLHGKNVQDLMRILERFGAFLADFHTRYNGMQHGDLTPANVFYDERSGRFALVDVADLAPRNPVIQSDLDRFISSLKLLSTFYGPDLFMQGKAQFEAGYNARRPCMPMQAARPAARTL